MECALFTFNCQAHMYRVHNSLVTDEEFYMERYKTCPGTALFENNIKINKPDFPLNQISEVHRA